MERVEILILLLMTAKTVDLMKLYLIKKFKVMEKTK